MKKLLFVLVIVVLAAAVAMAGGNREADKEGVEKKVTLTALSFTYSVDPASYIPLNMYAEKVEELSGGSLIIDWLGGPEIAPIFLQHSQVKDGLYDMTIQICTFFRDDLPGISYSYLNQHTPAEMRDPDNGFFDYLVEQYQTIGLRYLGEGAPVGSKHWYLYTKDLAVTNIDQLRGLTLGQMDDYRPYTEYIGATYAFVDFPDQYHNISTRITDGGMFPSNTVMGLGLHEIDNMYRLDHQAMGFPNCVHFVMNLDKFNSLSEAHQQVLIDAMIEIEDDMLQAFKKSEAALDAIIAESVTFTEFEDAASLERWQRGQTEPYFELLRKLLDDEEEYAKYRNFYLKD